MTLRIDKRRTSSDTNFHTPYFYFISFLRYFIVSFAYRILINIQYVLLHVHGWAW